MTKMTRTVSEDIQETHCSVDGGLQDSSDSRSRNLTRQSSTFESDPPSPFVQHQAYNTASVSRHFNRYMPYAVCHPPYVPTYRSASPPLPVPTMQHQSYPELLPVEDFPPQPSYSMPPPLPTWDCPGRIPVRNGMCVQLPDPQTGLERFYKVQYKCYQMTRAEANAYMAACCGDDGDSSAHESPSYSSPPTMELEQLLRTPLPPGCKEIKFPLYSSDGSSY